MTPSDNRRIDPGVAGASARREHDRRRANRVRRARERHPRIGGLLLALRGAPRHERAWAVGAAGEAAVGELLTRRCGERVVLLHDRRVPGGRANVDHIAVAPSGVWVIDSKRYRGKVEVAKPLFGRAKLKIAGRDKSNLADALAGQVDLVAAAVGEVDTAIPVRGVLCFVGAELPLLRTLMFNGHPLLYPRALAKRLNTPGKVPDEHVRTIAAELAVRFPPA